MTDILYIHCDTSGLADRYEVCGKHDLGAEPWVPKAKLDAAKAGERQHKMRAEIAEAEVAKLKDLIRKYIATVGDEEGTDFIDPGRHLTVEQCAALRAIAQGKPG